MAKRIAPVSDRGNHNGGLRGAIPPYGLDSLEGTKLGGSNQASARCKHCGTTLDVDHKGPCPSCGKLGKEIVVAARSAIGISEAHRVSWVKTREYIEKRPIFVGFWITLAVVQLFLGLVLAVWGSVVAGLIFTVIGGFVGFYAFTKVREVERGGG